MTLLIVLLLPCVALALNNGLALTPQMGFNTWNHFHCNISETLIRATADALVSSGLASMGYTYLNLDDCWAKGRFPNGTVFPDPVAFPSGMAALGDYIRSKGLKFGIYTDLGTKTCAGRPG
jgi:alpha-galactosidase